MTDDPDAPKPPKTGSPAIIDLSQISALLNELRHQPVSGLNVGSLTEDRILRLILASTQSGLQDRRDAFDREQREERARLSAALAQAQSLNAEQRQQLESYARKERFRSLLTMVSTDAESILLAEPDGALAKELEEGEVFDAFVMSVDIRRSTELMLKAKEPVVFAEFLTDVCDALKEIIFGADGVFDKFTGDGILAFFPEFFAGPDSVFRALSAASKCHATFAEHYEAWHSLFNTVILDTGLGIGIDYGPVQFVPVAKTRTIVGRAVVYACRMGSAALAGQTLLNQPAASEAMERPELFTLSKQEVSIKPDGRVLAHAVALRDESAAFNPTPPSWRKQSAAKDSAGAKTGT